MDMLNWIRSKSLIEEETPWALDGIPPCGTVGCIWGWGKALTLKLRSDKLVSKVKRQIPDAFNWSSPLPRGGAKLFDLTPDQAKRLFFPDKWPERFFSRLQDWDAGSKRYAKVVSDRIDFFIKTKGTDKLPAKKKSLKKAA